MEIRVEDLLKKNLKKEVIIFQTDTVYGIGCKIDNLEGVERIYEIKKRDGKKPLAVLCANLGQVKSIVSDFSLGQEFTKYWPGALTLIMPKNKLIGDFITSGYNTVGVRIPNDKIALSILEKFGPMAVTSLNLSTEPAILKYNDCLEYLEQVDYLVKGIDLNSISSTVYDCINKRTLRNGEIKIN
ncbi:Threonylcarbamoyl-AMP synthase [Candidatus Izimaplasma bacterium HR1]|jgi:L-threonylcarbamoyladenylate synthase|uniref:L-threonylcarbamoyladenylate synthase n=1 Tax=Candidatus Izimoplasma sp. HR1 TaxID=1541959 RepID=UPI0004F8111E|nr:Threonylcarbamoyl-AMP synthase [Candidatus Izimaplasma bacterium HR1]